MLHSFLVGAVPLIFASLGTLFTVLSGSLCIAVEGFMILGAFFSFAFSIWLDSLFWGIILTAVMAAALGFLASLFIQKAKTNPFVTALAINLAAAGISASVSEICFGTKGVLRSSDLRLPAIEVVSGIEHSVFTYLGLLIIIISVLVIRKSKFGLRLKSIGNSEQGALEHGIRIVLYKNVSWLICGALSALAGAALTWELGAYVPSGTAGRPWIAIAAVYLGFKNVYGTIAAAIFFAFIEIAVLDTQKFSFIPITAILGLPTFLALILYTISQAVKKTVNSKLYS